jgi:uncharacterized RDD family membrane protein YckC
MAIPVADARFDTVWARFAAGILDGLVLLPVGILDTVIFSQQIPWLSISWIPITFSAWWLYSVIGHKLYGKTVGKHLMKVVVLDNKTETLISWKQSIVRDIFPIVANTAAATIDIYTIANALTELPFALEVVFQVFFYSGLIWLILEIVTALTNDRRRAFHDIIAGTVVVKQ